MLIRQVVLDTETTGLDPKQGHRVIEIGAVEILNRRLSGAHFHCYLQPDREIDPNAIEIHGISNEFLADKPRFAEIADDFLNYIQEAELVIHNAEFDVGFLDHELHLLQRNERLGDLCSVFDTLSLARNRHPGQRNTLDALCKRYHIDNSQRTLHGALLDAELLADVYLAMTGGQLGLTLDTGIEAQSEHATEAAHSGIKRIGTARAPLTILKATPEEQTAHEYYLGLLRANSSGQCLWEQLKLNS